MKTLSDTLNAAAEALRDHWRGMEAMPQICGGEDDGEMELNRAEIISYLRCAYAAQPIEHSAIVLADTAGRLIGIFDLQRGDARRCTIPFRQLAALCVEHGGYHAILCHNHPSGDSRPSDPDLSTTAAARDFLASMEVILLDHLVVAASGVSSVLWNDLTARGSANCQRRQNQSYGANND